MVNWRMNWKSWPKYTLYVTSLIRTILSYIHKRHNTSTFQTHSVCPRPAYLILLSCYSCEAFSRKLEHLSQKRFLNTQESKQGRTRPKRSGFWLEKISILRVLKKKTWTPPRFFHRGPKKGVEHNSDIHFDLTWAKKIRNGFLCKKLCFLL